ncbi:hypothetical protein N9733_09685 [Akkermansiaceae bacterium]|nr:hypothetical protein [Akkermansiaceae bacterium]
MKKHISKNSENLPTQYELTMIAATVNAHRIALGARPAGHEQSVEGALSLWKEAGKQLSPDGGLEGDSLKRKESIGRYREAMKIGKHLLPFIENSEMEKSHLKLDDFLKMAVGLTEKADRMKWFRAFLNNWTEDTLESTDRDFSSKENYLDISRRKPSRPGRISIRATPVRINESEEISVLDSESLESFRKDGIAEPIAMAQAYRMWRLTMKTTTSKLSVALDVEDAIRKASV